MGRHHHILNAATNLLGIALVLISGLEITNKAPKTLSDEVAWGAAMLFGCSIFFSYLAIRADPRVTRSEAWADRSFLLGMLTLFISVVVLARSAL